MKRTKRAERAEHEIPRLYMHDTLVPGIGAIVSTACTGATCLVCAGDPAAAKRAENPYFPWEPTAPREPK